MFIYFQLKKEKSIAGNGSVKMTIVRIHNYSENIIN